MHIYLKLYFCINFSFCNQNIRKEYCSYLEDRQYRMLKFYNDTIVLDLPAEGYLADGWKLLPLNHPQVLCWCYLWSINLAFHFIMDLAHSNLAVLIKSSRLIIHVLKFDGILI